MQVNFTASEDWISAGAAKEALEEKAFQRDVLIRTGKISEPGQSCFRNG